MRPHARSAAASTAVLALGALLAGCGGASTPTSTPLPNGTGASGPLAPVTPSTAPTTGTPAAVAPSSAGSSAAGPNPNATESNPPGDIPDNQVFVPYTPAGASFSVKVPEGWARSTSGGVVTFSDKLNSIRIETKPAASAPTVASATRSDLSAIASSAPQFAPGKVSAVKRTAGTAVLVTYLQDSAPDPVTTKVVRDAVERYEFWHGGTDAILTLTGPQGADNVDPWRTVTDSLTWQ